MSQDIERVYLAAAHRDQMLEHAIEERPNEACGLLGGRDRRVEVVYPARNKEASPVRYEVEPTDLLRIFRELDERRLELVGIFHSHVFSQPYPSKTDVRLAYYPDAIYFLVSLMNETPVLKAYRIVDRKVTEVEIVVS